MTEKQQIAQRLREEILTRFGSIKEFAEEIGKTQQYVNVYTSGINSPGAKVRGLLHRAGLDVAYILTGRRAGETSVESAEWRKVRALMSEKGIKNVMELRQRLEREEVLVRLLGSDVYSTFIKAVVTHDRRARYQSRKKPIRTQN